VARKPPKGSQKPCWMYHIGDILIPREAMDTRTRTIPEGWILPIPVREDDTPTPYRDTKRGGGGNQR
jgi:hypothetical protein